MSRPLKASLVLLCELRLRRSAGPSVPEQCACGRSLTAGCAGCLAGIVGDEVADSLDDLPWHWAFGIGRAEVVARIEADWLALFAQPNTKETEFLRFLGEHPYFFLAKTQNTQFVLKELRLGADFTIDFVVPTDASSCGVEYELVEVERPDTPPFTEAGDPSARLTHAMQQVVDWKTWLEDHRQEFRELFPAPAQYGPGYEHTFSYSIIIGTRHNTRRQLRRRNALAKASGITIRTFDSLTEQLRKSMPRPPGLLVQSEEARRIPYEVACRLKNPFYRALGDAEWRALRRKIHYVPHFVECNAEELAEARTMNEGALSRFKAFCASQPPEALKKERFVSRQLYVEAVTKRYPLEPELAAELGH